MQPRLDFEGGWTARGWAFYRRTRVLPRRAGAAWSTYATMPVLEVLRAPEWGLYDHAETIISTSGAEETVDLLEIVGTVFEETVFESQLSDLDADLLGRMVDALTTLHQQMADERALEEAAGAHDEVIEVVEDTEEEEQNWAAAAPAPAHRALVQPTLHMFFFR